MEVNCSEPLLWVDTVWFLAEDEYGFFPPRQDPWRRRGPITGQVLALASGLTTQKTECDFW